ncbi:hypothetical protein QBC38DRAFT_510899 [Podospora fimiseda]|uniref:Mtf2-like C-terminal domain-containing protein n=1 Tax=Podospora fimiseda TaxID=252190 RepID=A0AAN7BLW4_9PEZI|nr:hypothetical protein QBC38DRAFT_510899 [Podospora fimiseda]
MSTTLLPFLYQTRTLQRLSRAGISTPAFRAYLHSSTTRRDWRRESRPRNQNSGQFELRPKEEHIPFELPDDFVPLPPKPARDFDSHLLGEDGRLTTITPSEKEKFKAIFEEIAAKGGPTLQREFLPEHAYPPAAETETIEATEAAAETSEESLEDTADTDIPFETTSKEPESASFSETINVIIQDAAETQVRSRRHLQQPYAAGHPLHQTTAASEWEKALLRFPPSLRKAARRALGIIEADKQTERQPIPGAVPEGLGLGESKRVAAQIDLLLDPLAKSVQHEALRRAERNRVEALMDGAKTDFELWDILEKEVFSLVKKLGLDNTDEPLWRIKKGKGRARKTAEVPAQDPEDEKKLPMHIYGPLYPTYLLNALRRLDAQFTRPSPLTFSILPRIKELGPASYVLGVSTPFYNELARLKWYRYGDPNSVFNLFEEMRAAGLYCDQESLSVLYSIETSMDQMNRGEHGPFLKELVTLPEWEYALKPRCRHWYLTITMQLRELGSMTMRREEAQL